MRIGRGWLAVAGVSVIIVVGLLISGARDMMVREFSIRARDEEPVAVLGPSHSVCEGPVTSEAQIDAVSIWGGPVSGVAHLTVQAQDAVTHQELASGDIDARATGEHLARLNTPVPGGSPLRICLIGDLNAFSVLGWFAADRHAVMSGKNGGLQFSLSLLNNNRSLLGSLPLAFSRASLWRPSWVGPWTFWVLAIALLATFGLAAAAVASATSADDDAGRTANDQGRATGPRYPTPCESVRAASNTEGSGTGSQPR